MGELHKFRDDVRSEAGRVKPVMSRALDDNFAIVRLKVSDSLAALLRIKDNSPLSDSLELAVSSGNFLLAIQDGALTLVNVPNDNTQFLNGALTFTASETCP